MTALNKSVPIIFTHKGNALFLQLALLQAKKIYGENIVLLGDESNVCSFVQHYNLSDYDSSDLLLEFKKCFTNLSPNSYDYELFCFERWFIILDFCIKNHLSECFCLDSDVLVYENFNCLKEMLKDYSFSIITKCGKFVGPQCSYFKVDALKQFCLFCLDFYKNKVAELKNLYSQLKAEKNISGISDMVLLGLFCEENPNKYIDFDFSKDRDFCFDENISVSAGFVMKNGLKKMRFIDSKPYGFRLNGVVSVRFSILHFQGLNKKYMEKYCILSRKEKRTSPYYVEFKRMELKTRAKKVFKIIPHPIRKMLKQVLSRAK